MMVDEEVRQYPLQLEATRNGITVAIPWAQRQANGAVIVRLHIQSARHSAGEILLNDTDVVALDGEERPLRTQVRRVWGYGALTDVTAAHLETARFDVGFRLDLASSRGHCGLAIALLRTFLPREGPRVIGGPWVFRFRVADDEDVAAAQQQETARQEAQRAEAARQDTARTEAARLDAERREAARMEAERREAQRSERARMDAERGQRGPQAGAPSDRGEEQAPRQDRVGFGARPPEQGDHMWRTPDQAARPARNLGQDDRGGGGRAVGQQPQGERTGRGPEQPYGDRGGREPEQAQPDRAGLGADSLGQNRLRRGPRFLRPEQTPGEDEPAAAMLPPAAAAIRLPAPGESPRIEAAPEPVAETTEKPAARRRGRPPGRPAGATTTPEATPAMENAGMPPAPSDEATGSAPAARRRPGRPRRVVPGDGGSSEAGT